MRLYGLIILSALLSCKVNPATVTEKSSAFLDESQLFEFHSHFWLNLHHFLYNKADVLEEKTIAEIFDSTKWNQLSSSEKTALESALIYYQNHLVVEDLRTGDYLYAFKVWVIQQSDNQPLPAEFERKDHPAILNNTADIYRKHWWDSHNNAHKEALDANLALIKKLEIPAKERLTQLVKAEWQSDKIRVDICSYVKQDRPFTTTNPTHIVMNVGQNTKPAGNWFELLIHEASHHFIFPNVGFIGETINQAADELEKQRPRNLWHGYLFYFTGHICQALLIEEGIADYETYMLRRNVFHWFAPLLNKHLPAYIEGEQTLLECTKQIMTDFDKKN